MEQKRKKPSKYVKSVKKQLSIAVTLLLLTIIVVVLLNTYSQTVYSFYIDFPHLTLFLLYSPIVLLILLVTDRIITLRYINVIIDHSEAIKALVALNDEFSFHEIHNCDMQMLIDNEAYYSTVSPKDYLIYELVYKHSQITRAIKLTDENRAKHLIYAERGKSICSFDTYSLPKKPVLAKRRVAIEQKLFKELVQKPITVFRISVSVVLTNINGDYKDKTVKTFEAQEINLLIAAGRNKSGDYYRDEGIWQSICRVERAKVSHRMRFAIYQRDGNRCRQCGSTRDLEIDHIFPISKGGKSTYDNLQTLCHSCNSEKSNTIVRGSVDPKTKRFGTESKCPQCGSTLIVRNGKRGRFLGCSSYPNCRFTKSIDG